MSSRTARPRNAHTLPWVEFKPWAQRGRSTPLSCQEILDKQKVDDWDAMVEAAKEDAWNDFDRNEE
jgi:hypothetical protein